MSSIIFIQKVFFVTLNKINLTEVNIPAAKNPDINGSQKGITISAARYASEDAATLVHYTIAILEYCKLCAPLKAAKERVEAIKAEMAENERKRLERENEVNNTINHFFD